jgi:F0F1-type ATP synthase membrane subunit c/vacuolar-type H+-ATPase subunit K
MITISYVNLFLFSFGAVLLSVSLGLLLGSVLSTDAAKPKNQKKILVARIYLDILGLLCLIFAILSDWFF